MDELDLITMVYHAGDKHAVRCKCRKCGAVGDVMSRNWNYDEASGAWEPQSRHIPDCKHLAGLRESAKGVVAKFTGIVPRCT